MSVTDIRIEPMRVTYTPPGESALDLGLTENEIAWAYELGLADVQAQQEGTNIITQLVTGENHTVTLSIKETDFENLKAIYQIAVPGAKQFLIVLDSNDDIDFNEGAGSLFATLDAGSFTPDALCAEIASKMTTAAVATISCSFSVVTNKFTISSDGATFELEWLTGANAATSIGSDIGYDVTADDTGSTSYEADNETDEALRFGKGRLFSSTIDRAGELNLHPIRLPDSDKSKDFTFWLAFPNPSGITFTGDSELVIEAPFTIYPDSTKPDDFQRMVIGDPTGFRSDVA